MKFLTAILCCLIAFNLSSQNISATTETNPRKEKPVGLNVNLGGPAVYSAALDYFVSPVINLEVGIGPAFYGGMKFHFNGNKDTANWTPFIGAYFTYFYVFDDLFDEFEEEPWLLYIPLGIHFQANGGFTFAVEASAFTRDGEAVLFGGLKLGYHF